MMRLIFFLCFFFLALQGEGQKATFDTLAYYTINKKIGIVDDKGNIIVKPIYDLLLLSCRDSLISVTRNERDGFIDRHGNIVIPLIYSLAFSLKNGLALVQDTLGKYGLINNRGQVVIPLIYDRFTFDSFKSIYSSGLTLLCQIVIHSNILTSDFLFYSF
jgi:hypothetical protein